MSEVEIICSTILILSGREGRSFLDNNWQPVEELSLPVGDALQIWQIDLKDAAALAEQCLQRLTPEERHHAEGYRVRHAREQFVIGRACIRTLLAAGATVRPEQVSIVVGAHGKPGSAGPGMNPLSFNVAHCRGMVVIAMVQTGAVGIDVERVDRGMDVMETARAALHPNELSQLEGIAEPEAQRRAFLGCWTRKEAVAKADGRGLSLPLSSFEVPVFEAGNTEVLITPSISDSGAINNPGGSYFVTDLDLDDEFVAAVAVGFPGCRIDRLVFPVNRLS